ncbi:Tetratricopeptide repeat-containing protein [Desulfuromusa kysingii]|uniref:Tetratricopeptide repeat-containing protein n=1 Tax=Desulfuromusa kysingii TaxID=37625 RepID=A0A1H3YLS5_9BACT|nr:tetratricopeptide repeat protein [Desulfuromusa kysingii]SEA11932.1 Tetratricopeptide repeat-containing protein [Desulfuromusa kysingii]
MTQPQSATIRDHQQRQPSVIDISKKARQKLRSRQYLEAKDLFAVGLEREPENPYLLSGMGDACREIGDFKEAERCYRNLLEVDPKNLFALRGLGDICKKQNRHQDAVHLWDRYLVLRPQDKFVMTRIAESCKILLQFERAEQFYRQILQSSPGDRFALTGLADLQHRLGKDAEAIEAYEKVLKFDANELHILTIIGKLCWRISDFEKSERYFRRALQVDPKNPYALYGLGNCFRWYRQYDKALEVWQKILPHSDGTQALHTRMGDAYFHLDQLEAAETSYLKSLTFGDEPYATAGLICLFSERKEWNKAAHFFWSLFSSASDISNSIETLVQRFSRSDRQDVMRELFRYLVSTGEGDQQVLVEIDAQLKRLS